MVSTLRTKLKFTGKPYMHVGMTSISLKADATAALRRADWLTAALRTDHAGEYGAVYLYRAILRFTRDPVVIEFASQHLETETTHLERMEALLEPKDLTKLLPLWRVAGYLAGLLPALLGRNAVFATVDAVETFVDQHYLSQLISLGKEPTADPSNEIMQLLYDCRHDELVHREEARSHADTEGRPFLIAWQKMIEVGSHIAVGLSTRW